MQRWRLAFNVSSFRCHVMITLAAGGDKKILPRVQLVGRGVITFNGHPAVVTRRLPHTPYIPGGPKMQATSELSLNHIENLSIRPDFFQSKLTVNVATEYFQFVLHILFVS